MISLDELIQTPYGELSAPGLEELRKSFDTRLLLKAVDDLDRFCALWNKELRADLLRLHGMAHTLINDAPLTSVHGEEGMCEAAFSTAEEFRDWQQSLRSAIAGLDQLAELAPD
jgi:hypothetical protein